ncbi:hypothetical protein HGRIS_010030 [Hohenbuehelia grisea]|uniref:Nuclear segregation protein Bfr1 n=1 Tax=Hohenbuehelia grisea TaxID=104357 RepID=A0ABR3J387_9AGAR
MAPKSKTASATNGSAKAAPPSRSETATPVSVADKRDTSEPPSATTGGGRPDKKVYDAEQERIKKDIDALNVKLSAVRDKISLATSKSGPGNERRSALHAELDTLRGQQAGNKTSRAKIFEQVKTIQDGIQKKIKDLQASKTKTPFKTAAEVDAHIKNLEKQIESGNMKLADEKRALSDISQCKRSRRIVEGFQAEQEAIDAERAKVDELKKQLDDPEAKAVAERYDTIRDELDKIKKESEEAYGNRQKLFDERDDIQAQLTVLYNEKRESARVYKEANDRFYSKLHEDRARRAERAKAQRAAEEAQKKQEIAERLRDEATAPAYQAQIEDCQTLIDSFSGKSTSNVAFKSVPLAVRGEVAGVAKHELRQVEDKPLDGLVVRKKKGEDEDAYFVGGKGKKGKKGGAKANGSADSAPSNDRLNVPLPTLSALLSLSIPPPASSADVPRVIEDLKTKKAWFEANQERVTAENVAKAEAEIQRLTGGKADSKADDEPAASTSDEITPPNGGGERPAEPSATPKVADLPSTGVSSEAVDAKLEVVQEQEASS